MNTIEVSIDGISDDDFKATQEALFSRGYRWNPYHALPSPSYEKEIVEFPTWYDVDLKKSLGYLLLSF